MGEVSAHLAEVERALRQAGLDPQVRAGLLADLSAQAEAQRAEGLAEARIVEALGDPADFVIGLGLTPRPTMAAEDEASGPAPSALIGRLSLWASLGGLAAGLAVALVGGALGHDAEEGGYVLFFFAQVAAIALGLAGWRQPLARAGLLTGLLLGGFTLML